MQFIKYHPFQQSLAQSAEVTNRNINLRKYRSKLISAIRYKKPQDVIDSLINDIHDIRYGKFTSPEVLEHINRVERRKKELGIKN